MSINTSAFVLALAALKKGGGGEPSAYLKSITKDTTNKTISIRDKQNNETSFSYGGGGGGGTAVVITGFSGTLTTEQLATLNESHANYLTVQNLYDFHYAIGDGTNGYYTCTSAFGSSQVTHFYVKVNLTTGVFEGQQVNLQIKQNDSYPSIYSNDTVVTNDIYSKLDRGEGAHLNVVVPGVGGYRVGLVNAGNNFEESTGRNYLLLYGLRNNNGTMEYYEYEIDGTSPHTIHKTGEYGIKGTWTLTPPTETKKTKTTKKK